MRHRNWKPNFSIEPLAPTWPLFIFGHTKAIPQVRWKWTTDVFLTKWSGSTGDVSSRNRNSCGFISKHLACFSFSTTFLILLVSIFQLWKHHALSLWSAREKSFHVSLSSLPYILIAGLAWDGQVVQGHHRRWQMPVGHAHPDHACWNQPVQQQPPVVHWGTHRTGQFQPPSTYFRTH